MPVLKPGTPEYGAQTRLRNAAQRALKVYPGPVGELISRELDAYAEFSFLWCDGRIARRMSAVLADVEGRPVPG